MKPSLRLALALTLGWFGWRTDAPRLAWLSAPAAIDLARLGRSPREPPRGWHMTTFHADRSAGRGAWLRVRLSGLEGVTVGRWFVAFRMRPGDPWEVYGVLVATGEALAMAHLGGDLSVVPLDPRGAFFETWASARTPEFAVFSRDEFSLATRPEGAGDAPCVRFER
jgi:hypothetical protein